MTKRDTALADGEQAADAAIQQVLEAEHQAREAVKGCREQAEAIREQARDRARHIGERADRRIERLQQGCQQALQTELDDIGAREQASTPGAERPYSEAVVTTAIRRLAADLTDGAAASDEGDDPQ